MTMERNPLQKFIELAVGQVGHTGYATPASFVVGCAQVAGVLNKVIPYTQSTSEIPRIGVTMKMGTYTPGPFWGNTVTPRQGDLAFFRWSTPTRYETSDMYTSDHVGIVVEVDGDKAVVVEVNPITTGATPVCRQYLYPISASYINGYFRPNWDELISENSEYGYGGSNSLYKTQSTEEDAALREIGYMDNQGKPSITPTGIRLCAVNYTSFLQKIIELAGIKVKWDDTDDIVIDGVDTSGLPSANAKEIADYFLAKGWNASQVIGLLANIQAESGFKPSAVNKGSGASGICQWLGSRKTAMIKFVGDDWERNLSGQLDYLWYELNSSEKRTLTSLMEQVTTVNEDSARLAADIVLRQFERPGNYDKESPARMNMASSLWSNLIFIKQSTLPGGGKQA